MISVDQTLLGLLTEHMKEPRICQPGVAQERVAWRTGGIPQTKLHHLIIDIDIVHVVLEYCWFTGAAIEIGLGSVVRAWRFQKVWPRAVDALYLGEEAFREDVQQ
jgi:hypothetical protein